MRFSYKFRQRRPKRWTLPYVRLFFLVFLNGLRTCYPQERFIQKVWVEIRFPYEMKGAIEKPDTSCMLSRQLSPHSSLYAANLLHSLPNDLPISVRYVNHETRSTSQQNKLRVNLILHSVLSYFIAAFLPPNKIKREQEERKSPPFVYA